MLQVVAFLAMEAPTGLYCDSIRDEQVKVFRTILPLDPKHLVRGQFKGYKNEEGVASDSKVETFAAVRLEIQSWRWSGVPFLIRAGKFLPVTATEVLVKLRKPPLDNLAGNASNYFRFRLGPGDVTLSLGAQVKRPGEELVPMPAKLTAVEQQTADELDAYERLLGDAMHGDGMLFVRVNAVEAAWAIVEPISDEQRREFGQLRHRPTDRVRPVPASQWDSLSAEPVQYMPVCRALSRTRGVGRGRSGTAAGSRESWLA